MRTAITAIILCCTATAIPAQEAAEQPLTLQACMEYAVGHSPAIRRQQHGYDTDRAEYRAAVASFLPSISVEVSALYNFGRNINEDNTYSTTTTFQNRYNGYLSLPLFDGGERINRWHRARANLQAGLNAVRRAKDDVAIRTMAAFVDVLYYRGTARFAAEKLAESRQLLHKTVRLEELGLKGRADVSQIEAQVAADDYLLTQQTNLHSKAIVTLKALMNWPADRPLEVDTVVPAVAETVAAPLGADSLYAVAAAHHPAALEADYRLQADRMQLRIERGRLFPTIALRAGIGTGYFEDLKFGYTAANPLLSFNEQLRNKLGEYVGVTVSIPLFDGWQQPTQVRRARNNVRIAIATRDETLRNLQTAIETALLERESYAKERLRMEKKVTAETLACHIVRRRYEEGLASPLDLQTAANLLIQSRADLLQKQLMYLIRSKEVEYYRGIPLIENEE